MFVICRQPVMLYLATVGHSSLSVRTMFAAKSRRWLRPAAGATAAGTRYSAAVPESTAAAAEVYRLGYPFTVIEQCSR